MNVILKGYEAFVEFISPILPDAPPISDEIIQIEFDNFTEFIDKHIKLF